MKESHLPGFTFRELDNVGDLDADLDRPFLKECFVDPGVLDLLLDCELPQRVLVGRTGAGKTAILLRIAQTQEKVTQFNPETLSLNYISNSTILPFLFEIGVNLDLFFDLLWRHVFATELIRQRYSIRDTEQQGIALGNLLERFSRDSTKRKALQYLRKWGDKFWIDADERVKELTERLEKAITMQGNVAGGPMSKGSLEAQAKQSAEAKREVVKRCQYVVDQVQANDLSGLVDLIDACLDDDQQRYYVLVDKLDDNWVDNAYKAALVRGLLRSVRAFQKVRGAKIIVGLRNDLLERIFEDDNLTAQREKFESLFYYLQWKKEKLILALDERVNKLVRSRYSASQCVSHRDVMVGSLGKKGGGPSAVDYVVERTLMRPRDLISYFNFCIREAGAVPQISAEIIKRAERPYSLSRLDALGWEWKLNYPNLINAAKQLLGNGPAYFAIADVSSSSCIALAEYLKDHATAIDRFTQLAEKYERDLRDIELKRAAFWLMYYVGLVGLKSSKAQPFDFSFEGPIRISEHEINENTRVQVHKCFWRALGIKDVGSFAN